MRTTNLLLVFFLAVALLVGFLISQYPPTILIWVTLAFAIFTITFVKFEWGLYILIFSMLLSPEITIGETAGSSLKRGVTLRFEDFLLLVIGLSWFAKNALNKELGLFLKTPLNKPIFFYILACIVSTAIGIAFGDVGAKTSSLFIIKYIEYFIVFFIVANQVEDAAQIRRLVFCLLLTCFITSIIGILQIPGGERISAPFEGERGEPNTLGGYLLFVGAIAAGLLIKAEYPKSKHYLIILLATIMLPFLFTQSRSSYLGMIPVCCILGLLTKRKVIVFGLLSIVFLMSPLLLPSQVKNRVMYTFTQPEASGQVRVGDVRLDTSTSARIATLKEIIRDWPKKPVFGYGVTGYGFIDSQLPRVLIETGILGLLAFLYLIYAIIRLTLNNLKELKDPYFQGLTIGFLAGTIGLLFHSLGANTFIIVRIMEPFWFVAGIIAVLPTLEPQSETQSQESKPQFRRFASAS